MPDISQAGLEQAALNYLERFDTSVHHLKQILAQRIMKAKRLGAEAQKLTEALAYLDPLLTRYQSSGILNDFRYGKNLLSGLRARGVSGRAAQLKLKTKGVSEELISRIFAEESAEAGPNAAAPPRSNSLEDPELIAALSYIKRRRLGPYRRPPRQAQGTLDGEALEATEPAYDEPSDAGGADRWEEPAHENLQGKNKKRSSSWGLRRASRSKPPQTEAAIQADLFQKDLAALARRGFSFDVARRALALALQERES